LSKNNETLRRYGIETTKEMLDFMYNYHLIQEYLQYRKKYPPVISEEQKTKNEERFQKWKREQLE
jgi:hypothetical protein